MCGRCENNENREAIFTSLGLNRLLKDSDALNGAKAKAKADVVEALVGQLKVLERNHNEN